MTTPMRTHRAQAEPGGWARWTVWAAGLIVALGAGAATAHGLYEVALAAGTPKILAWLYPLITDGLALVAYATTARLADHGRRYAWTIVVAAAGLSGLTQASYLAGGVASAPPALRFAIGAWPAIAAAIVAHLLFLLGTTNKPPTPTETSTGPGSLPVTATAAEPADPAPPPQRQTSAAPSPALPQPTPRTALLERPRAPLPAVETAVQPSPIDHQSPSNGSPSAPPVGRRLDTQLNTAPTVGQPSEPPPDPALAGAGRPQNAPAADRALTLAREHAARHGRLPTVRELATHARVARGTAAAALKNLRQQPTPHERCQITTTSSEQRTSQ